VLERLLVDSFTALVRAGVASLDRVAQDGVPVRALFPCNPASFSLLFALGRDSSNSLPGNGRQGDGPGLHSVENTAKPRDEIAPPHPSSLLPHRRHPIAAGATCERAYPVAQRSAVWGAEMAKKTLKLRPWTKEDVLTLKTLARERQTLL
jgi:hypothetical protein